MSTFDGLRNSTELSLCCVRLQSIDQEGVGLVVGMFIGGREVALSSCSSLIGSDEVRARGLHFGVHGSGHAGKSLPPSGSTRAGRARHRFQKPALSALRHYLRGAIVARLEHQRRRKQSLDAFFPAEERASYLRWAETGQTIPWIENTRIDNRGVAHLTNVELKEPVSTIPCV